MADRNYGVNINLNNNTLKNVAIDPQAAASADPAGKLTYISSRLKVKTSSPGSLTEKTIAYTDDTMTPSAHTHPVSQIDVLTADRALITSGSGYIAVSAITSTELSYLDDATSNIQTQINAKENASNKGAANGYCPLDAGAKVPAANLPGYVDDVREFTKYGKWGLLAARPSSGLTVGESYYATDQAKIFTATSATTWDGGATSWLATDIYLDTTSGLLRFASSTTAWNATTETVTTDKVYVDTTGNLCYRWSGSVLTAISQNLALASTSPANVGSAAAVGSATTVSKADHVHTIGNGVVTNAMQANMATKTIKANDTANPAAPQDITYDAFANSIAASDTNVITTRKGYVNTAITTSGGEATWSICTLARKEANTGGKFLADVRIYTSSGDLFETYINVDNATGAVVAKWNATGTVAAGSYYAIVMV